MVIYRTLQSTGKIILFSTTHGTFTKIDNGQSHKTGLKNKNKKKSTSFSNQSLIKIRIKKHFWIILGSKVIIITIRKQIQQNQIEIPWKTKKKTDKILARLFKKTTQMLKIRNNRKTNHRHNRVFTELLTKVVLKFLEENGFE